MWVHDLERDSQTRLTVHEDADFGPVWSPDGRWIAFCSRRDGHVQIYRQMADGSGQAERLLESKYDQGAYILLSGWEVSALSAEHHPDSLRRHLGACAGGREKGPRYWRTAGSMRVQLSFPPMGAGSPISQMNRGDTRSMFGLFGVPAPDGRSPRREESGLAGLGTAASCSTGWTILLCQWPFGRREINSRPELPRQSLKRTDPSVGILGCRSQTESAF